jgi:hypothetical protein
MRELTNSHSGSNKLVLCILGVHELGLSRDMAKVMSLLFIGIKDLVLVAHKLDGLLVLILLDGLCEGSVQDLASVGRDARRVKAVELLSSELTAYSSVAATMSCLRAIFALAGMGTAQKRPLFWA